MKRLRSARSPGATAVRSRLLAAVTVTVLGAVAASCGSSSEPQIHSTQQALVQQFGAGSLVIPMDTTYQAAGTLKAFGLVNRLLRNNIPIHWAINPLKIAGGVDFTASGKDLQTN